MLSVKEEKSMTLTVEEVKEMYVFIQNNELRFYERVEVKGVNIPVQNIVANYCWLQYSGETKAEFHCCKPGCIEYPCSHQ